jgi:hypothetical protein
MQLIPVSNKVLAALDVHTSKWIVDKCFKGDLVRGRTVLLVVSAELAAFVADMRLTSIRPITLRWRRQSQTSLSRWDLTAKF